MAAWLRYGAMGLVLLAAGAARVQAPTDRVFGWARAYANQPARKLAADPLFATLVQFAVPDVGLRMGRDVGLAAAFTTQIENSNRRVRLRDGRYLSFAGYRNDGEVSQSFFWVDLQQDRALGAIYFQLGGRPRLLVFSRREAAVGETAQLPAEFVAELTAWQRAARLPRVMPQYFAGARGQRLLLHASEDCAAESRGRAPAMARCESVNRDAAEIDMGEALALLDRRAPGGAAALAAEQAAWTAKRSADCAGPSEGTDCLTGETQQRAEELLRRMPGAGLGEAGGGAAGAAGAFVPPTAIFAPDPAYTDAALRTRVQGRVYLDVVIGADGRVTGAVRVENHLGYGLDKAAVATVRRWRWRPATRGGVPVEAPARIAMSFRLGGQ